MQCTQTSEIYERQQDPQVFLKAENIDDGVATDGAERHGVQAM